MSLNPYAGALGEGDAVQVMERTPEWLAQAVASLSGEQVEVRPAPGKWSVREVLAHLADCELAFGFRLRQAYGGERMVQPFDQDAWARAYEAYSAAQALETFRVLRAWNLAFVRGLTEADKRLPVMHPERGEMVLWTIVETMAGHDLHHLEKLEQR
jgi:uncharacterized damage-inducible protein DinB